METYMREWLALYESKSGERGMFNRRYADNKYLKNGRRETDIYGYKSLFRDYTRPYQFCNLQIVVRETDDLATFK